MFKYLSILIDLDREDVRHLVTAFDTTRNGTWYDCGSIESTARLFNNGLIHRSASLCRPAIRITDKGIDFIVRLAERATNCDTGVFILDNDETEFMHQMNNARIIGARTGVYYKQKVETKARQQRSA